MISFFLILFLFNTLQAQIIDSPPGCEDISYLKSKNAWIVSSVERREKNWVQGSIFLLTEDGKYKELTHPTFPFHPHGISILEKYGEIYVFVINHRPKKKSSIERFRWQADSLIFERTFEDRMIFSPNDVAAIDTATFAFSNDPLARNFLGVLWGFVTKVNQDKVVFWHQNKGNLIAKMASPNGLQFDKSFEKLYVSSVYRKAIYVFDLNKTYKNNLLNKIKTVGGPDNLEWDEEGFLWFASHPSIGKFLKHVKHAEKPSPTYIGKIDCNQKDLKVQEVWQNDGTKLPAASVASPGSNKIAIGLVFNSKIMFLDKNPK